MAQRAGRVWRAERVIAFASATGTITDDDNWKIIAETPDPIALEPSANAAKQENAAQFELKRTKGDEFATDKSYGIAVKLTLQGSATGSMNNASMSNDFAVMTDLNVTSYIQYDYTSGVYTASIPANQDSIRLYVLPCSDSIFEEDETISLQILEAYCYNNDTVISSVHYRYENTENTITILQSPEFVSDEDKMRNENAPLAENEDFYAVTTVEMKSEIERGNEISVTDSLAAMHNRPILYSFADGSLISGIFEINANTGAISIMGGSDVVVGLFSLDVKVYDTENPNLYDIADVNISFYVAEIQAGFAGAGPSETSTTEKNVTNSMAVGQAVQTQLVITGPNGITYSNVQWAISGGNPIKEYTKTKAAGIVTQLSLEDYQANSLKYYNTNRDASQTVSCTFIVNGKTYTESATLYIEQPVVENFTGTFAEYNNGAEAVGVRPKEPGDLEWLRLGGTEDVDTIPGITFTANVSGESGMLALTQLVNTYGSWTHPDGRIIIHSSENQYVLDTDTEYDQEVFPINYPFFSDDTPGISLSAGIANCFRSDSFKTYLMYKPEGDSIWVSLSLLEWGWSGMATNTETGWQGSGETSGGGDSVTTDDLPVWTNNVEFLSLKEVPQ